MEFVVCNGMDLIGMLVLLMVFSLFVESAFEGFLWLIGFVLMAVLLGMIAIPFVVTMGFLGVLYGIVFLGILCIIVLFGYSVFTL